MILINILLILLIFLILSDLYIKNSFWDTSLGISESISDMKFARLTCSDNFSLLLNGKLPTNIDGNKPMPTKL